VISRSLTNQLGDLGVGVCFRPFFLECLAGASHAGCAARIGARFIGVSHAPRIGIYNEVGVKHSKIDGASKFDQANPDLFLTYGDRGG
jgi:hypothetical protein